MVCVTGVEYKTNNSTRSLLSNIAFFHTYGCLEWSLLWILSFSLQIPGPELWFFCHIRKLSGNTLLPLDQLSALFSFISSGHAQQLQEQNDYFHFIFRILELGCPKMCHFLIPFCLAQNSPLIVLLVRRPQFFSFLSQFLRHNYFLLNHRSHLCFPPPRPESFLPPSRRNLSLCCETGGHFPCRPNLHRALAGAIQTLGWRKQCRRQPGRGVWTETPAPHVLQHLHSRTCPYEQQGSCKSGLRGWMGCLSFRS